MECVKHEAEAAVGLGDLLKSTNQDFENCELERKVISGLTSIIQNSIQTRLRESTGARNLCRTDILPSETCSPVPGGVQPLVII